jgi:hypothetical protein
MLLEGRPEQDIYVMLGQYFRDTTINSYILQARRMIDSDKNKAKDEPVTEHEISRETLEKGEKL